MKKIFVFILVALFVRCSFAQNDMTINALQSVPQSAYNNPAFIPECKTHLGIPALSSLYFNIGNTGFNTKDIITIDKNDSVHISMGDFINKLAKTNYFYADFNEELFSVGFKVKEKHYFNFSVTEKFNFYFSYPKELFEFAYYGNAPRFNEEIMIGKFTINSTHYREYALGYSLALNDKLSVGAKAKLLFGKANICTDKSEISLTTDDEFYDISARSDVSFNTCLPEELFDENDSTDFMTKDYLMKNSNMGFGMDLGVTYKLDNKFTLGLSVIDLGFINWKEEGKVKNYVSANPSASYTFSGIDPIAYFAQDTMYLDNLKDSIYETLRIDSTSQEYSSSLNTKVYLSAFYDLTKNDRFSGLLRLHYFNKSIHPAVSVSYARRLGNILRLTASYSLAYRNYTNLGVGASVNLGPLQFYVTTDNILSPILFNKYMWYVEDEVGVYARKSVILPRNWKYMNVHFGINLVFGYKADKSSSVSPAF